MRSRARSTSNLAGPWLTSSAVLLVFSIALVALLPADPGFFHRLGAEDGPIEWLSALLLFLACGFALLWLRRVFNAREADRGQHRLAAAGFVALFSLMAMEEISWFQREMGFDTPIGMAEANWQGEFNLHNFHTDFIELALYAGTGIFLVLLPLVRESIGRWRWVAPFAPFMPDRVAAAISAPMLAVYAWRQWTHSLTRAHA